MTTFDIMRVFVPATTAFVLGVALTPLLAHFLYKYKFWKAAANKVSLDGSPASTFNDLHKTRETGTPRAGGILVWGSALITAGIFALLAALYPGRLGAFAFISRAETWLPLAALATGGLVGFIDDLWEVRGRRGIPLRVRLGFVTLVGFLSAWWFYSKLGVTAISFPFVPGPINLGILFIPFFMLVALSLYAGAVIDGIDGLSGGVYGSIFAAYAGIAFFQGQLNLAALCAAILGALLAFLWFNIPPARFYLSETGTMGLTLALVVIVFLTDLRGLGHGLMALPVIALPLVVTVISVLAQILWKKLFHRKLLRIAPLHHHFEAIGWPPYKVTMRYWVVGIICAIVGMSIALL
jgi:phospho-N-acetylmuramoyl-pentapeptide-transferase